MSHGHHIYLKAYDISKATMCAYPKSYHALPHCKCVFRCCAKCPCLNLPDQETDNQYSDTSISIQFHIYHIILICTTRVRLLLNDRKICRMCKKDSASEQSTKVYTKKDIVMMETTIYNLHTTFYILFIQRLAFHITHVQILDTNHCGDSIQNVFKRQKLFQYLRC